MSQPKSGQVERTREVNHSPWQSCKDRTLAARPGDFLYGSMGETWTLSAARLGLPPGDLSASCGCACVLLEAVSKQKHPRKRIREAPNGLEVTMLHPVSIEGMSDTVSKYSVTVYCLVFIIITKTKQISKNSKDFTRSPTVLHN